jgi:hypothetical protein
VNSAPTFSFRRGRDGSTRLPLAPAGLLAAALALSACATTSYDVKVNAAAKPATKPTISYRIESHDPALDPSSLRYQEAETFVKTALSGKGLYEAPKDAPADLVVEFDFGISPPIVTQKPFAEPVFQDVGASTSFQAVQTGTDTKGNPIYSEVTTRDPGHQEFVGERHYMVSVTSYEKHLLITARENKESAEGSPPRTVWGVDVSTTDESDDLRRYLPVLLAASIDYIGKDSGGEIKTIRIDEKDPAIAFVKKGL